MTIAKILCVVVLCAAPLAAREKTDVIVLRNGDRITGEIKGLNAGVLRVDLDYVDGTLSIAWLKVARVESSQLFVVHAQDGSVYTGTLSMAPNDSDHISIAGVEPSTTVMRQAEVVKLEETARKFVNLWSGELSLGLVYSRGNRSIQNTFGSELDFRRERWGLSGAYDSSLSSSSGAETATRNQLALNGFRMLRKNYYYGGLGIFLQSSVQGIDLQSTVGGGLGRYFKNTNRARISVMGGFAWQNTNYMPSLDVVSAQKTAAGLITSDVRIFVFKKTNLSIRADALPSISEDGRVRFSANATYYLKLFRNLNWNLTYYGNWDTQPPPHFSGSDYGYSLGMTWKFGYR